MHIGFLVGNREGKRLLGRARRRLEVWTGFIWLRIGTKWRDLVNAIMNLPVL
jgi:hypothetical protein